MTAASACGISATDLATMITAKITSTASSTNPAIAPSIRSPSGFDFPIQTTVAA